MDDNSLPDAPTEADATGVTPPPAPEAAAEPDEERLSLARAAEYLGITARRLSQLRRRGEIPARRAGWRSWSFREADLVAYIARAGDESSANSEVSGASATSQDRSGLSDVAQLITQMGPSDGSGDAYSRPIVDDAPLVRMVNAIIVNGIENGASDIHVEPDRANLRIRLRIDGIMQQIMALPRHIQSPLLNRIKVMADVDVTRKAIPQLGVIPVRHGDRDFNLRVSVVPSTFGENVVIHVSPLGLVGVGKLGVFPEQHKALVSAAFVSSGLLLLAGPHGSGLTSTAMTLLNARNAVERNICSVEDVPEFRLGGIVQTYRSQMKGVTTSDAVDALLRHDPDILFVGDLRDAESAVAAVNAALSGVLVIATIAATGAIEALRRLSDFGVTPAQAARATVCVSAQRLARRLCFDCRETYKIRGGDPSVTWFGYRPDDPDAPITLYRAKGCDNCRNTGYKGRMGIFEVLPSEEEFAQALQNGDNDYRLRAAAYRNGMTPLREDALKKVLMGYTTIDEATAALAGRE